MHSGRSVLVSSAVTAGEKKHWCVSCAVGMTTQSVYAWSVGAFCILDVIVIELILKSIRCQIGNVWSSFKKIKK